MTSEVPSKPSLLCDPMLLDHFRTSMQADCRILIITLRNRYNCILSNEFKVKIMKRCLTFQYVGLQSSFLC